METLLWLRLSKVVIKEARLYLEVVHYGLKKFKDKDISLQILPKINLLIGQKYYLDIAMGLCTKDLPKHL